MILIIHTSNNKMWQRDTSLSLQAKGLMTVLTTAFESNSTITTDKILSQFSDGSTSMRTALEQLRSRKYYRLNKVRSESGSFLTTVWEIFDEPSDLPLDVSMVLSIDGFQHELKTNVITE